MHPNGLTHSTRGLKTIEMAHKDFKYEFQFQTFSFFVENFPLIL
jgi:hypothetical protein